MTALWITTNTAVVMNVSPPQVLGGYQCYEHLYVREREATIQEFQASSPHFSEFEGEMELYEKLEGEITELPASRYLNAAIQLSTGQSPLAALYQHLLVKTKYTLIRYTSHVFSYVESLHSVHCVLMYTSTGSHYRKSVTCLPFPQSP